MTSQARIRNARGVLGRIPARVRWEIRKVRKRSANADARRLWVRQIMDREVAGVITELDPAHCDAVEISGDLHGHWPWRSYRVLDYPAFDLCDPGVVEPVADVVICEQVLEHVTDPLRAAATLREVCRPGGHLIVSTPFLLRVHNQPGDYWRFTVPALRRLLENAGPRGDRGPELGKPGLRPGEPQLLARAPTMAFAGQRPRRPRRRVGDRPPANRLNSRASIARPASPDGSP